MLPAHLLDSGLHNEIDVGVVVAVLASGYLSPTFASYMYTCQDELVAAQQQPNQKLLLNV